MVVIPFGGFYSHGGTPIAGWFTRENPIYKWMMKWGNPILGYFRKPPSGDFSITVFFATKCRCFVMFYDSLPTKNEDFTIMAHLKHQMWGKLRSKVGFSLQYGLPNGRAQNFAIPMRWGLCFPTAA